MWRLKMRRLNKIDVRLWIALMFAVPIYFLYRIHLAHMHSHTPSGVWTVFRGVAPLLAMAIPGVYLAKSIQWLRNGHRAEMEIQKRNLKGVGLVFLATAIWLAIRFLTPGSSGH